MWYTATRTGTKFECVREVSTALQEIRKYWKLYWASDLCLLSRGWFSEDWLTLHKWYCLHHIRATTNRFTTPANKMCYTRKHSSEARKVRVGNASAKCDDRLSMWLVVEERVKIRSDPDVTRRTSHDHGESSVVVWAHVFSDKSQISLYSKVMVFHILHYTLLNFLEGKSQKLIEKDLSVLAHLPVSYRRKLETSNFSRCQIKFLQNLKKEHQIEAWHDCTDEGFRSLEACAMAGITSETSDKRKLKGSILLVYYVADIPGSEDVLSISSGRQAASLRHQRFVEKSQKHSSRIHVDELWQEWEDYLINKVWLQTMTFSQVLR